MLRKIVLFKYGLGLITARALNREIAQTLYDRASKKRAPASFFAILLACCRYKRSWPISILRCKREIELTRPSRTESSGRIEEGSAGSPGVGKSASAPPLRLPTFSYANLIPRFPRNKCFDHSDNSCETKDNDRATNAHFWPDKP